MSYYRDLLIKRYWAYQEIYFLEIGEYFDRSDATAKRPPVFIERHARKNVITNPDASQSEIDHLFGMMLDGERHTHFRSMNNSQALAQSVFGNLVVYGYLNILTELEDETGLPLFGEAQIAPENFHMEYRIKHLGERRATSLDYFVSSEYRVAIECKFTEQEFGPCSRPRLRPSASNYETGYCDGNYYVQRGRKNRCSLTESGVLYWKYIPDLFVWRNDTDIFPCSLNKNYQLVRNVLAACVDVDGFVSENNGHVVVIYDERNPAFQTGDKALSSYIETHTALKTSAILRMCSWQRIIERLRNQDILPWLTEKLRQKYGL